MAGPLNKALHCCAAEGCARQIPGDLLMCIEHWRAVPAALRREVYAAWSDRILSRDEYLAVRRHFDAVQQAVAAVATKEKTKQARRLEVGGDLFAPLAPRTT